MARRLRDLRLRIQLPSRRFPWECVVRVGQPSELDTVPPGGKLCDLKAGSLVSVDGSAERRVVEVLIEDADPPDQIGRTVTSGRSWLEGEDGG